MTGFFDPMPRSLAHRGNSRDYPENTEAAFRSALEIGADVIETDVHLLKDGEIVIFHDDDTGRLCGRAAKIRSLCGADLASLDMGWNFSPDGEAGYPFRGRGMRPLLLREALRLFPEARFNIDLKDRGKKLARAAAALLRQENAVFRVCVGSFHHSSLRHFRRACPEGTTSLCQREILGCLLAATLGLSSPVLKKRGVRAVQMPEEAGPFLLLTPAFIRWCHDQKLVVQVWTVNEEDKMRRLFKSGVDGIFSDECARLVRVCRDYSILAPPRQMSPS